MICEYRCIVQKKRIMMRMLPSSCSVWLATLWTGHSYLMPRMLKHGLLIDSRGSYLMLWHLGKHHNCSTRSVSQPQTLIT